jgi:hypothetical protein
MACHLPMAGMDDEMRNDERETQLTAQSEEPPATDRATDSRLSEGSLSGN